MATTPIAFVPDTLVARARSSEGALSGLTFAAKDLFAIRGHASTAGHPDWARTHPPAERHAPVVEQLLGEGADLVGVTILDELAFGLAGINEFYGTPENPRAAGRLCGGSSCGSAAAVAAALCDFALGSDTAGSVRVPAAFCGLFGIRSTHARLSTEGVVPLSPGFDAVGFMARDAHTFDSVASVLFSEDYAEGAARAVERVLVADDAFAICDAGVPELLRDLVEHAARGLGARVEQTEVAPEGFATLSALFARLRAREIWRVHGDWVREVQPRFSAAVQARFEQVALHNEQDTVTSIENDRDALAQYRERMAALLTPGTLLFIPPTAGVAPLLDASAAELEVFRARTLELSCIAALAGAPQMVVPARELDGAPIALSFVAARGADGWLSQLAAPLDRALES